MNENDLTQAEAVLLLESVLLYHDMNEEDVNIITQEFKDMIEDEKRTCWVHQTSYRYCEACQGVGTAIIDPVVD